MSGSRITPAFTGSRNSGRSDKAVDISLVGDTGLESQGFALSEIKGRSKTRKKPDFISAGRHAGENWQ
jgi:hypothetical protein